MSKQATANSKQLTQTGKIDFKLAFKLRYVNGLTFEQIAKQLSVTRSAVHQILQPVQDLIKNPKMFGVYHNNEAQVLKLVESEILTDLLDEDKRKSASLNNVAYAFGQLHQARRLESGASTSNVAVSLQSRLAKALDRSQADNGKDELT